MLWNRAQNMFRKRVKTYGKSDGRLLQTVVHSNKKSWLHQKNRVKATSLQWLWNGDYGTPYLQRHNNKEVTKFSPILLRGFAEDAEPQINQVIRMVETVNWLETVLTSISTKQNICNITGKNFFLNTGTVGKSTATLCASNSYFVTI